MGNQESAAALLSRASLIAVDGYDVSEVLLRIAAHGSDQQASRAHRMIDAAAANGHPMLVGMRSLSLFHVYRRAARAHEGTGAAADAAAIFARCGYKGLSRQAMEVMVRPDYTSTRIATPGRRGARNGRLTPRERDVARLIRSGGSNRDIARNLGISEHTVEHHVSSILARLGLRSRWQIAEAFDDTFSLD